jgi:hypothetical protein
VVITLYVMYTPRCNVMYLLKIRNSFQGLDAIASRISVLRYAPQLTTHSCYLEVGGRAASVARAKAAQEAEKERIRAEKEYLKSFEPIKRQVGKDGKAPARPSSMHAMGAGGGAAGGEKKPAAKVRELLSYGSGGAAATMCTCRDAVYGVQSSSIIAYCAEFSWATAQWSV